MTGWLGREGALPQTDVGTVNGQESFSEEVTDR